jgi:predicted nucleotidyltransferase
MQTIEKLKATLALHKEELKKKYKVEEIGIFGSYVGMNKKRKAT